MKSKGEGDEKWNSNIRECGGLGLSLQLSNFSSFGKSDGCGQKFYTWYQSEIKTYSTSSISGVNWWKLISSYT